MAEDPREPYGRTFHEQGRIPVNAEREKPFNVGPWEDRTEEQREIDMRGASAVAAQAVADAGLEAAELRKRLMGWEAAGPAILEALSIAVATVEYDHLKGRYKRTWAAVNALEEGTGHG